MQVIEVVPISKGISKERLSYFTGEDVSLGSVIEVPLRRKEVPAIVVAKKEAADLKSEIRSLDYEMKKIIKHKSFSFFLPEFIESAEEAAIFFSASTGSVLSAVIPSKILEDIEKIKIAEIPAVREKIHEKYILQAPDEERLANYKSFIREQFAKKSSVFFCLPTIHDLKNIRGKLDKGIEEYTYILHNSLPAKELSATLEKLSKETHPVLIIATGIFLSFPRSDIGAIIIDKQNSLNYKTQSRPYLDLRKFAEILAKKIKAKFVVGDIFVDVETMYRHKNGEYQELAPLKFRSLTSGEVDIVDMRKYKEASKKFTLISDELKKLIEDNKNNSENLYIYSARTGLSSLTICADCGNPVTCDNCEANMVLHASKKGNFFLCHRCGERRDPTDTCKVCGSWKLSTLGIGLDKLHNEIKDLFPDAKIFTMDKEIAPTHKRAQEIINKFYSSPGSLLIGTEIAIPYLDKEIENGAVGSIDSLFSIPDFRISEKIMSILIKLRSLTNKKMIIQTRSPEQEAFKFGTKGNLFDFYKEEIDQRRQFNYPPFSTLIKISVEGSKDEIVEKMSRVKNLFEGKNIDIFPSFIKSRRGKSIMHALLRVPSQSWPDKEIVSKLISLSPEFTIKVDPESLL